jgi:hypothetical protein
VYDYTINDDVKRDVNIFIRCTVDKTGFDTVNESNSIRYTQGLDALVTLGVVYEELQRKQERKENNKKWAKKALEKKMEKLKAKRVTKIDYMPSDPFDYARVHGLLHDIIWDKNITGQSNRMFLLLTRFVKCHIRLDAKDQQEYYFNRIIYPYFASRKSKNLSDPNWKEKFFKRFESLCRLAKKDLEKFLSQLEYKNPGDVVNTNNVKVLFEEDLASKLGRTSEVFREVGHKKLQRIIYDAVGRTGRATELAPGEVEINFYIPKQVMSDSIGGRYRDLLRVYEETKSYKVDYKYIRPYIDEFQVWNKGLCKKHTIYLKCDINLLVKKDAILMKKRLNKEENRVECLSIMQRVMDKKKKENYVSTG